MKARFAAGIFIILLASIAAALDTSAATLVVTKVADTADGVCDGDCSLREAVSAAATGDTVVFSGLFSVPRTITLTLGPIEINKNVTIVGPDSALLSVSGNNASRIFLTFPGPATLTLSGITLRDGRVTDGAGGAINFRNGELNLSHMVFTNNYVRIPGSTFASGSGAAISAFRGNVIISNSSFYANLPSGDIGNNVVDVVESTLSVTNSSFRNNSGAGVVGGVSTVSAVDSVFSDNSEGGIGATNLTVRRCTVANNGGGVGGDTLLIDQTTIIGNNNVDFPGGGVSHGGGGVGNIINTTIANNRVGNDGNGGGISNSGPLYIQNSSIFDNEAEGRGGGIWNLNDTVFLTNSTVSGNRAMSGGGIYDQSQSTAGGSVFLTNSTVAFNQAGSLAGGIVQENTSGTATLRNSIVAKNTTAAGNEDVRGVVVSYGFNLIGNIGSSSGWISSDLLGVEALLAPLGSNGGYTQTHALRPGSPAINAGSNTLGVNPQSMMPLKTDQRGSARIVSGTVDIGAYEANYSLSPVSLTGRIFTQSGRGLSGARVTLTDEGGQVRYARTNPFGYFRFLDLPSGATYTITASDKFYSFASPITITTDQNRNDLVFTGSLSAITQVTNRSFVGSPTGHRARYKEKTMKKRTLLAAIAGGATAAIVEASYFLEPRVLTTDDDRPAELRTNKMEDAESSFAKEGMQWRLLAWQDENGDIPDNPITGALDERDYHTAQLADPDGFSDFAYYPLSWKPRGPSNVGGRTRALVIHPTETKIMWAASVSGGVWKSTNGGESWTAANGGLQNYSVVTLALDPSNPNILYAGTGEGVYGDGLQGDGIFKSVDGGMRWNRLPQTAGWKYTSKIAISANGNTLLASTTGSSQPLRRGIVRSTDGGNTWELSRFARDSSTVVFHPTDNNRAIAEIWLDNGCSNSSGSCHKVIYTANAAATPTPGGTPPVIWSEAKIRLQPSASPTPFERIGDQRIDLTYAKDPEDDNVAFAMYKDPAEPAQASISRSLDFGAEFEQMDTDLIFNSGHPDCEVPNPPFRCSRGIDTGNFQNTIWAWDRDLVIAGGVYLHRSENGGDTVRVIAQGDIIHPDPHADSHCIVPDPGFNDGNNKIVYVCNDGGIYKTDNIRTAIERASPTPNWRNLNTGYQTTQFYGAAGHGPSGLVYGGTQDNANLRLNAANSIAQFAWAGDGGGAAVDPDDDNYCYGEYIGIVLHRTSNCDDDPNGQAFIQQIDAGISDIPNQTAFVNRFVLDPNDSTNNTMLYGGRSLWRTTNVKVSGTPGPSPTQPTWEKIKDNGNDVPRTTPTGSPTPTPPTPSKIRVTAVAIAEGGSNPIWMAESDFESRPDDTIHGRLYRGFNPTAEPEWVTIDDNTSGSDPLPNRSINRIAVAPTDPEVVYVAFGGFESVNLYRTLNGGANWTALPGTGNYVLPEVPIRGIAIHPDLSHKVFVGTEIGVYVTEDGGTNWKPVAEGPANVSVDELVFMSNSYVLVAATHGRGIWTANVEPLLPCIGCAPNDFDGDGRSDIAVVRHAPAPSPSATQALSTWHTLNVTDGYSAFQFGLPGDQIVPDDYDGDGKTDLAVFRESNHTWYCLQSSDSTTVTTHFGDEGDGDTAVPGDFNGDDVADEAVYRPSTGYWWLNQSTAGVLAYPWGLEDDVPVAEDFDGDGNDDLAVFRLKGTVWYLLNSGHGGHEQTVQFGLEDDIPAAGDYDGDGRADIALWRPSDAHWYIAYAVDDFQDYLTVPWGLEDDIPVPGD